MDINHNIPRVVALGFFDGVHIGHSALLEKTRKLALEKGVTPAVMTFDTHPDTMIRGGPVPLINSPEDRAMIIREIFSIQDVIFLHFDQETMHMDWEEFVLRLKTDLGAVHVVAGHDFHFGYKGLGNPVRLQQKCAELGMGCDIIPKVCFEGITISSTYIRSLLLEGDMERANLFLGHPHVLTDEVRVGYKLGRTLGAPTINMRFPENVLVPRHGVYAAMVRLPDGSSHYAVTNVGVRPTVGGKDAVSVESYILDYSGNLYGQRIRLEFFKFLRPEKKFQDVATLQAQIHQDAADSAAFLDKVLSAK